MNTTEKKIITGKTPPKVSVCVTTYNQEKYIAQCLQSLVDQETDFDFEIIVADDCSTDETRAIVQSFKDKYPDKFRLFLHDKNIGAYKNFYFVHEQAWGEYIAHMDGDDYSLPGKLQAQVDFLDANQECNIVFHRVAIENDHRPLNSKPLNSKINKYRFFRKDIIEFVAIGANSSKMYRKINKKEKFPDFDLVDYTINVISVGDGYAAYCSDSILGVYRKGIGISGSPAVIKSVYNSLRYFHKIYPQHKAEIHASTLSWLASNIKNRRPFKMQFFILALQTLSLTGIIKFLSNRNFKKGLGK